MMKILCVGLGSIGQRHLRNLRTLGSFEYVALRSRRQPLPSEFDNLDILAVTTLDDAVATQPDIAFLCAPPVVQQAVLGPLVRDTRCHFFIEKPVAPSLTDLADLVEILETQGRKSVVGYNLRFHPISALIRDTLAQGALGNVCSARVSVGQYLPDWHPHEDYRQGYSANRLLGGGVVLDLIHEIDLLCSWFGNPDVVKAIVGNVFSLNIDTEAVAEIVCRFPTGVIGSIHLDYVQRVPRRQGTIIGDAGTLSYDLLTNTCQIDRPGSVPTTQSFPEFVRNDMYVAEVRGLLDSIRSGAATSPSLREGVDVLTVALRAKSDAGVD